MAQGDGQVGVVAGKAMSKAKAQSCATCVYARWVLTKTGRISSCFCGECMAPLPVTPIVSDAYRFRGWDKLGVWPNDGRTCPAYSRREGMPQSR